MLVDSHCHLDFPDFAPERDAVIARARAAGLGAMLTISTRIARFDEIKALAEAYPDVLCTVGTHPHNAAEEPDVAMETLVELSRHPRCVGIGEAGLDYHYGYSPKDVSERVFRTHIAAARLTGLPLVIHARDADDDMIAILTDEMGKGAFPAVLHCSMCRSRAFSHSSAPKTSAPSQPRCRSTGYSSRRMRPTSRRRLSGASVTNQPMSLKQIRFLPR
jgi:TatD DNase family protein